MEKKMLWLFIFVCFFIACNNEEAKTAAPEEKNEAKPATTVTMPFKIQYSDLEMGDPNNAKMVLDMYKNWNDNKLDNMAGIFGDTLVIEDARGNRIIVPHAGLQDSLAKWRGMSTTLSSDIVAALSMHSKEHADDWVLIWTMNKWTGKDGKKDSVFSNDNWQIRNGKLTFLSSLEQKPVKNP
jgi:hypothetical protein